MEHCENPGGKPRPREKIRKKQEGSDYAPSRIRARAPFEKYLKMSKERRKSHEEIMPTPVSGLLPGLCPSEIDEAIMYYGMAIKLFPFKRLPIRTSTPIPSWCAFEDEFAPNERTVSLRKLELSPSRINAIQMLL